MAKNPVPARLARMTITAQSGGLTIVDSQGKVITPSTRPTVSRERKGSGIPINRDRSNAPLDDDAAAAPPATQEASHGN